MKIQLNPAKIGISFIIFVLALYPAFLNYKYNNHSKNWLNHDYGKNLLSSTEEYSVFMTEGGDNQVFSSLYFTYAEKLRQDLFPYDQKGNIFKRIYGDLRYVTSDILDERSVIVNKGLFTGQEPFYTDIRSLRKPYLVPYALGKPSTYLTWRLPDQHLLGDFYYKNYGIMYKVQEIRYAIVDYVETLQTAQTSELIPYLQEKLGRDFSMQEFDYWVALLVQDGLVTRNRDMITFVKSYPKPFKKDPKESFIRRWQDIPNLPYFDYLSREIVVSFAYEQLTFLGDTIEELQRLLKFEESPDSQNTINQQIQEHWIQIQEYITIIKEVGHDSSATLHNLGIFYLTAEDRFDFVQEDYYFDEALVLWEQALDNSPYAWSTYNVLLWGYLRQAFIYPENSEYYLDGFDKRVSMMIRNIRHWKSMQNVERSQPYQQSAQIISVRDQYEQISGAGIIEEKRAVMRMVSGQVQIETLQSYISKVINQLSFTSGTRSAEEFFDLWIAIWKKHQSDPSFMAWHLGIVAEISSYQSLIDRRLFVETLRDARRHLPSMEDTTDADLQLFINAYQIAVGFDDQRIINLYLEMLLQRAEAVLPAEQYESIKQQLEQTK